MALEACHAQAWWVKGVARMHGTASHPVSMTTYGWPILFLLPFFFLKTIVLTPHLYLFHQRKLKSPRHTHATACRCMLYSGDAASALDWGAAVAEKAGT